MAKKKSPLQQQYATAVQQINQFKDQATRDVNYGSREVTDFLHGVFTSGNGAYNEAVRNTQSNNDALTRLMAQTSQANMSGLQAEQERLGIQQSGLGSFLQDQNWAQMGARQNATNERANIETRRSNYNMTHNMLAGMNAGSTQEALNQIRLAQQQGLTEAKLDYDQRLFKELQRRRAQRAFRSYGGGGYSRRRSYGSSRGSSGSSGSSKYSTTYNQGNQTSAAQMNQIKTGINMMGMLQGILHAGNPYAQ